MSGAVSISTMDSCKIKHVMLTNLSPIDLKQQMESLLCTGPQGAPTGLDWHHSSRPCIPGLSLGLGWARGFKKARVQAYSNCSIQATYVLGGGGFHGYNHARIHTMNNLINKFELSEHPVTSLPSISGMSLGQALATNLVILSL